MIKLYHYPLCPLSRQIRVILKELNVIFSIVKEDYWLNNKDFLKINPAGNLPVLTELSNHNISGIYPIMEYINDEYSELHLMKGNSIAKAEIRRLFYWFNDKFYTEVTNILIDEKIIRLISRIGSPRTEYIKIAKNNLSIHLNYLSNLLQTRGMLSGESLTIADIAAACQISVIDYFGEINWNNWPQVQLWYSTIKSRPSFRPILQDHIPGFTPSTVYADLDF
ncbi:MAG: glutathione S-transferase family protein [Rickettsiaceae bacterium]|nr:MAG: glutathione S-transferase family protein [Rickettsiaceae bacterium]